VVKTALIDLCLASREFPASPAAALKGYFGEPVKVRKFRNTVGIKIT
jgi:hypothetical protein